jgi:hypothetical protein
MAWQAAAAAAGRQQATSNKEAGHRGSSEAAQAWLQAQRMHVAQIAEWHSPQQGHIG